MTTDELREKYLAFFEEKGCTRRPSDVLVPRWDPSVLFTPAGMNQFKDQFLGKVKLEFTRATSCQKCLRTGDIQNVGRTAYHHTFFEMLGNFSFGDYFKREAIHWAWQFLTDPTWLGIDAARLSASVYLDDLEAYDIWHREIKLPPEKIQRLGEEENFWPASAPSTGPDGVCGPCSEIFFHTDDGGDVEIWNLVFTQFHRVGDPPDNLRPLPSKNIDTGMGLERTAAVLQGVDTNFHIDILRPLVEAAAEVCHLAYEPLSEDGRRLRRIADHVRACTFAVHENVYPGPNKEKYVIRRLLRRAVLDGHQLGVREPFAHRLVSVVAGLMGRPYPEMTETVDRVGQVIRAEEENFFATVDSGLQRIERLFAGMRKNNRGIVSGAEAADMYTTYGFPPELFESLAAEHNIMFDWAAFRQAMQQHGVESGAGQRVEIFQRSALDPLKKVMHVSEFLGYETTDAEGTIKGIIAQGALCDCLEEFDHEEPVIVVLDRTPFYGESGGQVGDRGKLLGDGLRFDVVDTQRDGALILHLGHLREGRLSLDTHVTCRVDDARRHAIRRAHSATHMLHFALQRHLGGHAQQQGSKVDADWLRFDFTHPQAVTGDELRLIEAEVNQRVMQARPVTWQRMPLADARKAGAMMLFGEKYPDVVRMVSMGDFSKELCGGTHLDNTGQAGLFKIIAEESVSAGTRRITAVTGAAALAHVQRCIAALDAAAGELRVSSEELPARVAALAKDIRELKKRVAAGSTSAAAAVTAEQLLSTAIAVGDTKVIAAEVPGASQPGLRSHIDQLRRKASPVAVMLGSRQEEKVLLVAGASRDLVESGFDASRWIREVAQLVGGSGGGRKDLAQAGGKQPSELPAALERAKAVAVEMLSP